MRLIYMDEAGIGSINQEPYLLIAGVMINPDTNWKALEKYLSSMTNEYFPGYRAPYGKQFVFHAKDIWHGSGAFPRADWSRTERMNILSRLSKIPADFKLTVVGSFVERRSFEAMMQRNQPGIPQSKLLEWTYVYAFLNTARRIEQWMRENATDQVAMTIAEDTDRVKQLVSAVHSSYTDRTYPIDERIFQSQHIVDSVHFAKKDSSVLLQIADHCAFFLKRKMMKCPHSKKFSDALAPQLFLRSADTRVFRVTIPPSDWSRADQEP